MHVRRNKEEQAIPPIPQPMISDEGAARYFPSLVVTTVNSCLRSCGLHGFIKVNNTCEGRNKPEQLVHEQQQKKHAQTTEFTATIIVSLNPASPSSVCSI